VTFIGRLGSYRYLDMDVTIGEALTASDAMVERITKAADIPVFFAPPLQHA
jgi:UDP-galactopyranose mutase